jgi:hypothetical protein
MRRHISRYNRAETYFYYFGLYENATRDTMITFEATNDNIIIEVEFDKQNGLFGILPDRCGAFHL